MTTILLYFYILLAAFNILLLTIINIKHLINVYKLRKGNKYEKH